jgi:hypothetical protein
MPDPPRPTWLGVTLRTCVVHTVTYFAAGLVAFFALDYTRRFEEPPLNLLMRSTSDSLVAAGPLFQPLRGVLFGLVLWLVRDSVFGRPKGWLTAWAIFGVVGILSPFGPAPGSIEGLIYTKIPISLQLAGLSEVIAQSLLLACITCFWVNRPQVKWLTVLLVSLFAIVLLLSALGTASRMAT